MLAFLFYFLSAVFLYCLTLLEAAFLPHFFWGGSSLSLVFVFVFLLNFLSRTGKKRALALSFSAGLLLDFWSGFSFGLFALLFLVLAYFLQKISSFFEKHSWLGFSLSFILTFFAYYILLFTFVLAFSLLETKSLFLPLPFSFQGFTFSFFIYLLITGLFFFGWKRLKRQKPVCFLNL